MRPAVRCQGKIPTEDLAGDADANDLELVRWHAHTSFDRSSAVFDSMFAGIFQIVLTHVGCYYLLRR